MVKQAEKLSTREDLQDYAPYILVTLVAAAAYFLLHGQVFDGLLSLIGISSEEATTTGAAFWGYQIPAVFVMAAVAIVFGSYLETWPWKTGALVLLGACGFIFLATVLIRAVTDITIDFRPALMLSAAVFLYAQLRRSSQKDRALFIHDMAAAHRRVLLQEVCENTYDGILVADYEGNIIYANKAVLTLFGYSENELVSRSLDLLTPTITQGRIGREMMYYLEEAKTQRSQVGPYETTGLRQDGSVFSVDLVAGVAYFKSDVDNPLERRTQDRPVYICNMRDVSARKKMEEARHAALEQQVIANRAKSEFVANMSHELRTPLNAIIGFSEMLSAAYFGDLTPKQDEYVKDIHFSATHLLKLINDILDISKIESGRMELQEEDMDVKEIVTACINLVQHRADEAEVTVDTSWEAPSHVLYADERKLKQVLLNLLSNAVKFTPSGGHVQARSALDGDGSFVIAVVDSGVGIAEDDVERCLAPFGQVDSGLDRKYEGTGLGLPLTKSLVEAHGGTLTLESSPGVGTTVTVRLPADRIRKDEFASTKTVGVA